MLKIAQAAFAVACVWGFSDVHDCPGCIQMAPYLFDKQTASCNSPDNWLMCLAMYLAALCNMYCRGKMALIRRCHLLVFSEDVAFTHHFVATYLSPPCRIAGSTSYASKH